MCVGVAALLFACLFVPGTAVGAAPQSSSSGGAAAPAEGGVVLRVALDEGVSAASFRVAQGSYTLTDLSTGIRLGEAAPGGAWVVTAAGNTIVVQGPGPNNPQPYQGPIILQETGAGGAGGQPGLFTYEGIEYRGSLAVQNLRNSLLVMNLVDMEYYLYGVVGKEMGGGASPEAYCAQAVVSRSYALSMRNLNAWYDIGRDTGSQAYGGYSGEREFAGSGGSQVVDAVNRTRGQVLEYMGALVKAFFCANAGGFTEDVENVWAESLPYLRGVASDGDAYADTLGGWAQSTYRWTKTLDRSELESQLGIGRILGIQASRNRTRVSKDPVTGSTRSDFVPGTVTVSGRVTEVTVTGTGGAKTYCRDSIRQPFGLKSTLFDLDFGGRLEVLDAKGRNQALGEDDAYVEGRDGAPLAISLGKDSVYVLGSGNRLVTQDTSADEVTFSGRGYGHGVGLSQWGAIGLAVKGYNYRDILELYYNQGKHDGDLQIVGNYGN